MQWPDTRCAKLQGAGIEAAERRRGGTREDQPIEKCSCKAVNVAQLAALRTESLPSKSFVLA